MLTAQEPKQDKKTIVVMTNAFPTAVKLQLPGNSAAF